MNRHLIKQSTFKHYVFEVLRYVDKKEQLVKASCLIQEREELQGRLNEFWLSPIFIIDGMFSFMLTNPKIAPLKSDI